MNGILQSYQSSNHYVFPVPKLPSKIELVSHCVDPLQVMRMFNKFVGTKQISIKILSACPWQNVKYARRPVIILSGMYLWRQLHTRYDMGQLQTLMKIQLQKMVSLI